MVIETRGWLTRSARKLGKRSWFSRIARKLVPLDLAVQRRSGGRISLLRMIGLPYLVLTATGRRSGQPRSVPLMYMTWGSEYVVVGSNWGQQKHPAWSANLLVHPDAIAQVRGRNMPVHARQVTGQERRRLWREVIVPTWPAYDTYDERSGDREIRVFALTPRS